MLKAAVKERPILFSGAMVRAILEGRKTQTRRVVKPTSGPHSIEKTICTPGSLAAFIRHRCPYGQPGDRLWVRETWGIHDADPARAWFRADPGVEDCVAKSTAGWKWRPSIHMPRWASRITLRLTDVRVERVQDISVSDCIAEGLGYPTDDRYAAVDNFKPLWDSINAARGYGWDANPWVWVLVFEPVPKEIA